MGQICLASGQRALVRRRSIFILSAVVLEWKTKDKRSQERSNENAMKLVKNIRIPFYRKHCSFSTACYFGGARSKGFATLRNVSKLTIFYKIGHAKSVGFRFFSAIWRSESPISSKYLEITSISLIYSLNFSRKKELLFWLPRGLNRLTCVTRRIRGDSKLRD